MLQMRAAERKSDTLEPSMAGFHSEIQNGLNPGG
jgi:hypothetical protein